MPGFLKTLFEPSAKSIIKKVRAQEERLRGLSDEALREKTDEFRARIAKGADIFSFLPEAFACVVVASERTVEMRHFDVQIQGGVELARGQIVEMKTGEGKTLVATLPAYLHALMGKGVHIVTVNDYLARRDAEWMGPIYERLGLSVGVIQENMAPTREEETALRKAAYACDITYVTNSELVFDSLRDNLAYRMDDIVQRGYFFAVVDEVDLLLVDEAQTPLIISGPGHDDATLVRQANAAVRGLEPDRDYKADHRSRAAYFTEEGQHKVEKALEVGSLSDPVNLPWAHATYQALQAHGIYRRDVEYIIAEGEIHIVDEHTGRVSPEKRYSNGLHQALEAKEGVRIKSEDLTLAKTSYQYFFRGYEGLSGMTGTAWTEREELRKTYQAKVVRIPTHKPMIREDYERVIYVTLEEKHAAVIEEIQEARELGRPVLVGTVSVEESEALSRQLRKLRVKHEVLNARSHEREAQIIAQAGRAGAVTISTNMAGRGTDIALGGSAKHLARDEEEPGTEAYEEALKRYQAICGEERETVVEAGGLLVIGTGEHESERIDNQLRGRAGRQGDPGASVFIVALEDPVYRRFGEKRVLPAFWEELAEHPEGEPVDDAAVLDALEELRRKVEVENQAIRLDVFKYDSVVHDRRERIWGWRRSLLTQQDRESWLSSVHDLTDDLLGRLEEEAQLKLEEGQLEGERPPTARETWQGIVHQIMGWLRADEVADIDVVERDNAVDYVMKRYEERLGEKEHEAVIEWERLVLLDIIDFLWPQYLNDLERVEEGIWMRQYAQIDPFVEFRKEAAIMFGGLIRDIELNALRAWMSLQSVELDEEAKQALEKATSMLELEAGGQKNPDPIITSSRKSGSGAFGRGIPAPGQRRKRRR